LGELLLHELQLIAKALSKPAQTTSSEEINGETHVLGRIQWEYATNILLHQRQLKPLLKSNNAHILAHFTEQNLDENATGRRGILFCQFDTREDRPVNRIRIEQVSKELRNVVQLNRAIKMNGFIVLLKELLIRPLILTVYLAQLLTSGGVHLDH